MTRPKTISKAVLVKELRTILSSLCDRINAGDRLRLSDVRNQLAKELSLDFAEYFKFLKRYNYVLINRGDQSLAVTEEGRNLGDGNLEDGFYQELEHHFSRHLKDGAGEAVGLGEEDRALSQLEKSPPPGGSTPEGMAKGEAMPTGSNHKHDARYVRYDAIGSGGIGTVYKGRHNSLAIDVAIKEIKDLFSYFNFLQRSEVVRHLKEVVSQMAILHHPLCIQIFDQNTEVAHPFFVMEYLAGGNLRSRLSSVSQDIDQTLIWFTQIAYALRAAHRFGLIHGGLKPENILLDERDNIRLSDFSMSKLLQTDSNQRIPRVVTGSIGYLSPEQMADPNRGDITSDIYSLGILLYEMLTGNLPGRRSPLPSAVNEGIPKTLDDLFDRMTRDNPEERYPDLDALLSDFYDGFPDGRYLKLTQMILMSANADDQADGEGG